MRLIIFAAVLFHAANAWAQPEPKPDWRAMLDELYRIDMAFDVCKGVTPTAGDMLRLETAIAFVEEKTEFEEDELDEIYGDIEREALAGADFCGRMTDAVERLRAVPQDYR
jgi:hypothetical protein